MFDRFALRRFFHHVFSPPPVSQDEQHWMQFFQSLSPGAFIMWLANDVADRLTSRTMNCDVKRLTTEIADGRGRLQKAAEDFLSRQQIDCDPTQQRRITIFRHLMLLRLRHLNKIPSDSD